MVDVKTLRKTVKILTIENELNNNSIKNQIEDDNSCLSKSLAGIFIVVY